MLLGPGFRGKLLDLPVGGHGQPGEDVAQVGVRIKAPPTAALDDGIEDGAAFPGIGLPDEHPVFLAEGGGTDGVLHQVLIDLDASVGEVIAEQRPQVERLVDGQAHPAARKKKGTGIF